MSESFLDIRYSLSRLHSEQLILLNECMFPCSLYIICPFMGNFQYIPHLLCRTAFWHPEKLIKIQGRCNYVLCNAVILNSFIINFRHFIKWFLNRHTIHIMHRNIGTIHYCIPNAAINWLNKDLHFYFPELVINTRKHGWSVNWGSLNKRQFILSHGS